MKILISDKLAGEGIAILEKVEGFTVDHKPGLSPEELKKIIKDYDALIVRSGTKVTAEIIKAAEKLQVIGRAGVGLDNVDLKAATEKGVVAMNTPAGNTTSTAEHTFSMILALSRNIPQAAASMKSGKWERAKFGGVELHGKTLGIVGLGRIGSTVAKFARAFEMDVQASDPYLPAEVIEKRGVTPVEMETLFKTSDYITIHIPKSSETVNLIDSKELEMMKPSTRLINCARGGIINEDALAGALKANRIAGCALDVYDQEPLSSDSPLLALDNCIMTPHLGASTSEAQVNVAIEIAECVRDALLGRGITNAANYPSVDVETYRVLEPYINLGAQLGAFSGQLMDGAIKGVTVTYTGSLRDYKLAPVTLSLMKGLLQPILGDTVNNINSVDIAKQRGVDIREVKSSKEEEFVNCVKIEIETDKKPFLIWGILSGNQQPRVVRINEIYAEAVPEGHMLFIENRDKPGLVGAIGKILADADINIASITLGREGKDGTAVSVVNVDSEVPAAVIAQLKNTKDVISVKTLLV